MRYYKEEKEDMSFERVRFESFAKLVEETKEKRYNTIVTLHYEGNHICGHVGICFSGYDSKRRNEYYKLATEIIEFF